MEPNLKNTSAAYQSNSQSKEHRDPITGEPGSHPFGTAVGTLGGMAAGIAGAVVAGAATGATAGAVIGPVGGIAGTIIGGVIGGLTGHEIAEQINPTVEDTYWNENYSSREYVKANSKYDTYRPAYRYGVDMYVENEGADFDAVEPMIGKDWDNRRGTSTLNWNDARPATRDAYERLSGLYPVDRKD